MSKAVQPRFRRYSSETRAAMLVDASLVCLARGGILDFTIDSICREAGVSRGLITHHFGSKDGLLAAVYATMYDRLLSTIAPTDGPVPSLVDLVEATFAPEVFNRSSLKIWLALWGETANNAALQAVHRRRYGDYRASVVQAIAAEAARRNRTVDADALAVMFIALSDGVWLEQAIDPSMLSPAAAQEACFGLLEAYLGPLPRTTGATG
jgi:AcrR family transcriptional regulator